MTQLTIICIQWHLADHLTVHVIRGFLWFELPQNSGKFELEKYTMKDINTPLYNVQAPIWNFGKFSFDCKYNFIYFIDLEKKASSWPYRWLKGKLFRCSYEYCVRWWTTYNTERWHLIVICALATNLECIKMYPIHCYWVRLSVTNARTQSLLLCSLQ